MSWTGRSNITNPEYRPAAIGNLDRRRWQARMLRDTTADLIKHVGGRPTTTQALLIEQIAQLRMRLAMMDKKHALRGRMSLHDSRTYLAWANSYSRMLKQLGLDVPPEPEPDWQDIVYGVQAANQPREAEETA